MCGICGKYYFKEDLSVNRDLISKMNKLLSRRGPDEAGIWVDNNIGFGVRMLHILDKSRGKQPFFNEDKSIVSVCNGEIYNYKELKTFLIKKGHCLQTDCDAEIISHLYEEYRHECVKYLNGMFAFALFDRRNRFFLLARDRMGIKPLYYTIKNNALIFSSELTSLMQDEDIPDDLDPVGINQYVTLNYFPDEYTPFKKVKKLLPGHSLRIENKKVFIEKYWQFEFKRQALKSEADYIDEPEVGKEIKFIMPYCNIG